jgi:glycosyltransferase involved in cell wall biosynthesis
MISPASAPRQSRPTDACISIVIPIYNEETVIPELYQRLNATFAQALGDFEFILVNDGSSDRSAELVDDLCARDSRFKALHFSRNFGHQAAVTAGMRAASGDCVIVMDADLQDPPEVVNQMLARWREGFDVVYAQRVNRIGESAAKRATAFVFYRALRAISEVQPPPDTGDFCLMDRQAVDVLNALPERNRYIRGLRAWIGFDQTAVPFERQARYAGETKYPFSRMVRFAVDGMLALSKTPLRIATYFGFIMSGASFLLAIIFVIQKLSGAPNFTRGWASTIVIVLFLGGIQLICLGVIGEFIGRIYDEVKQRPLYVVEKTTGLDKARAGISHGTPDTQLAQRGDVTARGA